MNNQQLLEHYNALAERHQLATLKACTLQMQANHFSEPSQLLSLLEEFSPRSGWLTYQSGIHAFDNGTDWRREGLGAVLNGECCNDNGESLMIRPATRGWVASRYRHSDDEQGSLLYETLSHANTSHAPGPLRYRRYWQRDEGSVRPLCAVYSGLGGQDE